MSRVFKVLVVWVGAGCARVEPSELDTDTPRGLDSDVEDDHGTLDPSDDTASDTAPEAWTGRTGREVGFVLYAVTTAPWRAQRWPSGAGFERGDASCPVRTEPGAQAGAVWSGGCSTLDGTDFQGTVEVSVDQRTWTWKGWRVVRSDGALWAAVDGVSTHEEHQDAGPGLRSHITFTGTLAGDGISPELGGLQVTSWDKTVTRSGGIDLHVQSLDGVVDGVVVDGTASLPQPTSPQGAWPASMRGQFDATVDGHTVSIDLDDFDQLNCWHPLVDGQLTSPMCPEDLVPFFPTLPR